MGGCLPKLCTSDMSSVSSPSPSSSASSSARRNNKASSSGRSSGGAAAEGAASAAAARDGGEEEEALSERCRRAVDRLVELKINFLAIDFDQTLIDVHTGGVWRGTLPELAERARPTFVRLMAEAHERDIHLAIVTFSPQVGFIREFLHHHFPTFADSIIVRGRDRTWSYEGSGSRAGKQSHMASAAEELSTRIQHHNHHPGGAGAGTAGAGAAAAPTADITRASTLLIDDDANNVRIALSEGVRAIWLNPDRSDNLLRDMKNLT